VSSGIRNKGSVIENNGYYVYISYVHKSILFNVAYFVDVNNDYFILETNVQIFILKI